MKAATALTITAVAAIGMAGGAYLASRTQPRAAVVVIAPASKRGSVGHIPNASLAPDDEMPPSGLAIENGQIVITSYDEWVHFAPDAIEDAIVSGMIGAEGVLTDVMRRALPRYRWPPDPGSPLERQWPEMVLIVAEKLRLGTDPDPSSGTARKLRLL